MAAGDGLIVMQPTSIVVAGAGSSASINSDGGVDFTSATSLSLNGVFTSSYDNYLLVIRGTGSATPYIDMRLRASGSDASGTNYASQYLYATGTSLIGGRGTSMNFTRIGYWEAVQNGLHVHMYGPYLAQPTAMRSVGAFDYLNAYIEDRANTHSLSTSYDGLTIFPTAGNITGNIVVFGYEE